MPSQSDKSTLNRLARALPDIPRWVETISMLLAGRCEVFGLEEDDDLNFVVRDAEDVLISVVGSPAKDAIQEAVARGWDGDVVAATPEDAPHVAEALPGWEATRANLHLLGDAPRLPDVPAGAVRLVSPSELSSVDGIPSNLLSEFRVALSPIAAGFEDGKPVSFCYVAARTEGLWDISIDTLEGFRRRGHAARCVAYMVRRMRREGLQPVWGAEEWNEASLGLAARLGFVPADEVLLFRPARA